jgi:hypothetical protein
VNCQKCHKLIYEYIDKTLPPKIEMKMDDHFQSCQDCREKLAQERHLAESMKSLFDLASSGICGEKRVLEKIRALEPTSPDTSFSAKVIQVFWRPILRGALILSIIFTVLFLVLLNLKIKDRILINNKERLAQLYLDSMLSAPQTDWQEKSIIITIYNSQRNLSKIIGGTSTDMIIEKDYFENR